MVILEVLSKYVEDEQQSNLINDHHDYSNNIRSSMPSQSLAIQEKLKMFEQTSPPPTNTTVQQQNSNIFDVNSGITGRKLYQPSTTAATSIQQQQQYNDQVIIYNNKTPNRILYKDILLISYSNNYNYRQRK